jgi:hypothetical protein
MLPPTGAGPIEVTRETLDGTSDDKLTSVGPARQPATPGTGEQEPQEQAPQPSASPVLPGLSEAVTKALTMELPKEGEPTEVIVACEKRLHAANSLLEAMQKKVLDSYFHYAGPAVRLAWSTESWRATVDPTTGKECRSWSAWLRMVKVSRQHAYRMTKEEPIMEALKGLDVGKLGVRQIDALSPVLTNFGKKAVREVWTTAMGWGDTSAPSLLKIRAQLGHEPLKVVSEGDESGSGDDTPVLRFQTRAGVFDAARVREVAKAQPDIALLVAKEIFAALGMEQPE